jgi:hypothetical protein
MISARCFLLLCGALLVLLPGPQRATAQEPFLLPVLLRLEGVGAVYGIAGGVRNLSDERGAVAGGAVGGDVKGQGAAVTELELWSPRARLSLFLGHVERAHLTTSYTRGTAADRPVEQTLAGFGAFGLLTFGSLDGATTLRLGAGYSTVVLEDFHDSAGNRIPLPGAKLEDINTTHLLFTGEWRKVDDKVRPRSGVVLGFGLNSQTGRAGQSDMLQAGLRATGLVPLGARVTLGVHFRSSDAQLLRRAEAYDTPEEPGIGERSGELHRGKQPLWHHHPPGGQHIPAGIP